MRGPRGTDVVSVHLFTSEVARTMEKRGAEVLKRPLQVKKAFKSRIPQSRAVPTAVKNDATKTKPQQHRRKWQSFDLTPQSQETIVLQPSERQLRQLKEDLADESSAEASLQMAKDLLEGTKEHVNDDEASYRREQAAFWLMKAGERGSREAMDTLRNMHARNGGLTDANQAEVAAFLSLDSDQLVAQRVGRKLFRAMSAGTGFVAIAMVHEVAQMHEKLSPPELRHSDKWLPLSSAKETERLDLNDCIKAAEELVDGQVPQADLKLMEYEARKMSKWTVESIFLCIRLCVLSIYMAVISCLQTAPLQVVLVLLAHRFTNASTVASLLSSLAVAAPCALAVHNVGHVLMHQRRYDKWQEVFAKEFSDQEICTNRKNEKRQNWHHQVTQLGAVSVLVSMTKASVNVILMLFSASLIAREGKKKFSSYLLILGGIYYINYCSRPLAPYTAQLSSYLPIECQSYILDLPHHVGGHPAAFVILTTIFWLSRLGFSHSLIEACKVTSIVGLCVTGSEVSAIPVVNVLVLATVVGQKWQKGKSAKWSCLVLCLCVAAPALTWCTAMSKQVPMLTWTHFKDSCPSEQMSVEQQKICFDQCLGAAVSWEGTVMDITVEGDESHWSCLSRQLQRSLKRLCVDPDNTYFSPYLRQLVCLISRAAEHLAASESCRIQVLMRKSMFQSRDDLVTVSTDPELWQNCSSMTVGEKIRFSGILVKIHDNIVVKAENIFWP